MNEPKRWLDDGAPEAIGRMLRAAGDEQPSSRAVEHAVAGVAVGAGITGAAVGTAGASVGVGLKSAPFASGIFLKWTLLGSLVTLGAGGLVFGLSSPADQQAVVSASARSSAPAALPGTAAVGEQLGEQPTAPEPAASNSPTQAKPAPLGDEPPRQVGSPKSTPEPAAEVPVVEVEALARETKLVDRARAELAAGRAAAALAILDEYQTQFPRPRYAPEALYLRMEALLARGNTRAARQVATRLASSHPNSPHAARAEALLSTTIP